MGRWALACLLAGSVLAAACGTGEFSEPPASSVPATGASQPAEPAGELVPNVTLQLDDGSSWTAGEAARPALLVFWAEW